MFIRQDKLIKHNKSTDELKSKALEIRNTVMEMCISNGGHIASSFSCVEILLALYQGGALNISKDTLDSPLRDRFILSKGHGETVLYAVLADMGFFPQNWLFDEYRKGECYLGGHPDKNIPGVEHSTGSLGHGLGVACGLALAAKMDNHTRRHYVLLGDAECTEGSVWEACLFAAANKLNNLTAIIDRNNIGSIDYTEKFTALSPFAEKWQAFGWKVITCDGHDFDELSCALQKANEPGNTSPVAIIAKTTKGKGVSFIENDPLWHVKQLNKEDEIAQARAELSGKGANA